MTQVPSETAILPGVKSTGWPVLVHCTRTTVVAVASVLVARIFRLPETYGAPITTLASTVAQRSRPAACRQLPQAGQ
jgi:hypothetical protein